MIPLFRVYIHYLTALLPSLQGKPPHLTHSKRSVACRSPGSPLKRLVLAGFRQTPDATLRGLAAEARLKYLLYLRLGSCQNLTNTSVRQILTKCQDLIVLELADCELLTPEILKAHAESGSKTCLGIWRCDGVRPEMLTGDMRLVSEGSGKIRFNEDTWDAEYRIIVGGKSS